MSLKSIVILLFAVAVIAQEDFIEEHQLAIGVGEEENFNPGPLLLHLRPRRQAKEDNNDRGSVGADVSRGPDGTRVRADADYNIHTSRDGRTTVDAQAGWERTYHGPQGNSRPDYNVGIGFRHRW